MSGALLFVPGLLFVTGCQALWRRAIVLAGRRAQVPGIGTNGRGLREVAADGLLDP